LVDPPNSPRTWNKQLKPPTAGDAEQAGIDDFNAQVAFLGRIGRDANLTLPTPALAGSLGANSLEVLGQTRNQLLVVKQPKDAIAGSPLITGTDGVRVDRLAALHASRSGKPLQPLLQGSSISRCGRSRDPIRRSSGKDRLLRLLQVAATH
jgi:hypothetical protein